MSTPNGYNNPAYCHQFDSSLYEYQYVPEIDPDSREIYDESDEKTNQRKLVHPKFAYFQGKYSESDEFEGSDESNRSIIIEECNNRRVTLICEKRNKAEVNKDEFYEDRNFRGAYYQDVSLESENSLGKEENDVDLNFGKKTTEKSLRHQRPLEPPLKKVYYTQHSFSDPNNEDRRLKTTIPTDRYSHAQKYHRYEEIPTEPSYLPEDVAFPSVHRYAEITSDENGYPTLEKEIKIRENSRDHFLSQRENYPGKTFLKPKAPSPVSSNNFTSSSTPPHPYQRNSESKDFSPSTLTSSSPFISTGSPIKNNSFEMAELSPPRFSDKSNCMENNHTLFIYSPKRQPPIGASSGVESQEFNSAIGRCILPKNLQQFSAKPVKGRCHSLPGSPRRKKTQEILSSPKPHSERKTKQIFHVKPVNPEQSKVSCRRNHPSEKDKNPARRNILSSFTEPAKESPKAGLVSRSPYKPTTTEIVPPRTAVITPIFQRKNQQLREGLDGSFTTRSNFGKMSHAYQSTSNIFKSTRDQMYPNESDPQGKLMSSARIKRNQSVPNFSQTLAAENRLFARKNREPSPDDNQKYSKNLQLQYSPKKPIEHLSPTDKSRLSLTDQSKSSWSVSESNIHSQCAGCFMFATVVHLVTATATCAITFYLLSKFGRKYYLDFGLLAGFVNFILGLLGFRSYCWTWLPNRNYVSGFIGLAAFSALTCAGLTFLIIARPMAGDPIIDVLGGAICAVSVLTIVLSLTGLTMSGCCKAPPPDNRVTDI